MKMNSREAMINGNNTDVVRNTIYFSRKKSENKVFVLVEGISDVSFYKNVVEKNNVHFIPMGETKVGNLSAKENVIKTIEILNAQKVQGVIAIVDTDYDQILGVKREIDNLIYTDSHDLETMILRTDAYEKFENEFGNDEKINAYEKEHGGVLDNILKYGDMIGRIRLLSVRDKLKLDFKSVDLQDYFNDSLELDWESYFKQILYVSKKISCKCELNEKIKKDVDDYDIWQLCRGHDLTELIVIFYSSKNRYELGNSKARLLKSDSVEQFLQGAYYVPVHFLQTNMCKKMLEWQLCNQRWNVLKKEFIQKGMAEMG